MKGSCTLETGYTFLGRRQGDFSNAPKVEFLCRKVTFGYVGIVQNMKKVNSTLALTGRVLRDTPPPLTY
jgi:hypothetical protein